MKVLLIKSVKNLGKVGDIIEVASGFARNYLIPHHYAIRMTKENQEMVESNLQKYEEKNREEIALAQEATQKIENNFITFIRQTSNDGKLFGSVNSKEIIKELNASSNIKVNVDIKPIKNIGIHEVAIQLHPEVSCKVFINIARSSSEAQEAFKKFNNLQNLERDK